VLGKKERKKKGTTLFFRKGGGGGEIVFSSATIHPKEKGRRKNASNKIHRIQGGKKKRTVARTQKGGIAALLRSLRSVFLRSGEEGKKGKKGDGAPPSILKEGRGTGWAQL